MAHHPDTGTVPDRFVWASSTAFISGNGVRSRWVAMLCLDCFRYWLPKGWQRGCTRCGDSRADYVRGLPLDEMPLTVTE